MNTIIQKKDYLDCNIRELGYDIIMNLLNKNKNKFENEISLLKEIIEKLFQYALEIEKDVPNDWIIPHLDNYFDYTDHKEEQVEFAIVTLDKLIRIFDKKKMMTLISGAIMELLKILN